MSPALRQHIVAVKCAAGRSTISYAKSKQLTHSGKTNSRRIISISVSYQICVITMMTFIKTDDPIIESYAMKCHYEYAYLIENRSKSAKIQSRRTCMKEYKKKLTDELEEKNRYPAYTRFYKNVWNGRDPILTYLSTRQTKRFINIIDGGHYLGHRRQETPRQCRATTRSTIEHFKQQQS